MSNNENTLINSRIMVNNHTNNDIESSRDLANANKNIAVFDNVDKFVAHNLSVKTDEHSVIFSSSTPDAKFTGNREVQGMAGGQITTNYFKDVYGKVSNNKLQKLMYYRQMVSQAEMADALDEIAESCINVNDKGQIIECTFNASSFTTLSSVAQETINKHFNQFVGMLDLKQNGFYMFRELVTDGEITWENVIDVKNLNLGIIDLKRIKPESYEYLIDSYYNHLGILINASLSKYGGNDDHDKSNTKYAANDDNNAFGISKYTHNAISTSLAKNRSNYALRKGLDQNTEIIPMPMAQITHAVAGSYSDDRMSIIPILDRARRAYNQLVLLEDASIIYRLVRAPERLIFNVDVGESSPSRANQQVKQIADQYSNKKVYDSTTGGVTNGYDAHQMLESMFFPKTANGTGGTTVESLGGSSTNFGTMEDIKYFQQKLFASLKIPYNRFSDEGDGDSRTNVDTITYAEYRFSKFVMRIQQSLAGALKESFITHLKLTGIWDSNKMTEDCLNIDFIPPSNYEYYTTQRLLGDKFDMYSKISSNSDVSKTFMMKNILKWNDDEIEENYKLLQKEKIRQATIEQKVASVTGIVKKYSKLRNPEADDIEANDDFDDFGDAGDPGLDGGRDEFDSEFDDDFADDFDDGGGADFDAGPSAEPEAPEPVDAGGGLDDI